MRGPEHISEAEMRTLLRDAYAQDPERTFLGEVARRLRDPAMPHDAKNRSKAHPLWLMLGLIAAFVFGVFIYFSLLRS
jgi:hypothetical protein